MCLTYCEDSPSMGLGQQTQVLGAWSHWEFGIVPSLNPRWLYFHCTLNINVSQAFCKELNCPSWNLAPTAPGRTVKPLLCKALTFISNEPRSGLSLKGFWVVHFLLFFHTPSPHSFAPRSILLSFLLFLSVGLHTFKSLSLILVRISYTNTIFTSFPSFPLLSDSFCAPYSLSNSWCLLSVIFTPMCI